MVKEMVLHFDKCGKNRAFCRFVKNRQFYAIAFEDAFIIRFVFLGYLYIENFLVCQGKAAGKREKEEYERWQKSQKNQKAVS